MPLEKIISSKIINHSEFKIHGRRINFTITIDTDSIRVLTDTDKDEKTWIKINDIKVLEKYIKDKNESMKNFKDENSASYANNRKHTNIGIFRAYIREYLKAHPFINSKKGINIRNLSPGKDGLPVLVKAHVNNYAISGEIFRTVESDIIDHVVSVMKVFDLKILQYKKD